MFYVALREDTGIPQAHQIDVLDERDIMKNFQDGVCRLVLEANKRLFKKRRRKTVESRAAFLHTLGSLLCHPSIRTIRREVLSFVVEKRILEDTDVHKDRKETLFRNMLTVRARRGAEVFDAAFELLHAFNPTVPILPLTVAFVQYVLHELSVAFLSEHYQAVRAFLKGQIVSSRTPISLCFEVATVVKKRFKEERDSLSDELGELLEWIKRCTAHYLQDVDE
ncbi:unnamed protein product [Vitrella brassicaformis CCMP3155]|uniref:Uncharacterized protein n=1 Tax=Vitrella brassicaformis (strain CCMP3155) TaxID=1169540 RepID=A0A0G4FWD1_VITBC|nr:unnamed protein product [Vitrella brassicaformis CCMP3155]|eukprot:CEM19510.1 unnamed protein product [Vitrella brassicaformis CCMP3155]